MNILIVDDNNDKIIEIISLVRGISESITIESAIDIISAQLKVKEKKYDLMIVDLLLPLRKGDEPISEGGKNLVNEIARNPKLKSPTFIVGFTQFEEHLTVFPRIWNTINYSASSSDWKEPMKEIIYHLEKSLQFVPEMESADKKPTIFVEGKTDKKILKEAFELFDSQLHSEIAIETDSSAGASWVARQVIIWAHSLSKENSSSEYIKAIGLLDGDVAGNEAKDEINLKVKSSSAESKTFKVFQLKVDYARHFLPLVTKGLLIPITIEEMFASKYWEYAKSKQWLEQRTNEDTCLKDPKDWNKLEHSLNDHIKSLGIGESDLIFLQKVKDLHKEDFANYLVSLEGSEKKEAFSGFEKLIEDFKKYFNIPSK